MTNNVLHWGDRSTPTPEFTDRDYLIIVPVTMRGDITPESMERLKAVIEARSTATHRFNLEELALAHNGRFSLGPKTSDHVAYVHAILK